MPAAIAAWNRVARAVSGRDAMRKDLSEVLDALDSALDYSDDEDTKERVARLRSQIKEADRG